jgi:tetratricopeptide (TPR) repeat protein
MSATPRPQTDDAEPETGPADAEGWALLDALRRKLDDQAAQTRKTSAQVQQLADSIAALVGDQRKRSRWLNVNSFVAYLMFTLLCAGAFYFVYQSRAHEVVAARDRAATDRDTAVRRADEANAKLAARDAADAKAWDTWQALEAGKKDDALKKLAELKAAPLSKFEHEVLAARAKQAEMMQVDAAMKAANTAFKAGRYGEVVVTLESALNLQGAAPRVPEMHYLIGLAHLRANEIDKAVPQLETAVTGEVSDEDARFQLASALDRVGQWSKARAEYDRFATAHPQNPSAVLAMRRSATLARMPAQAPWVPVTPPKPAAPAAPAGAAGASAPGAVPVPTAPKPAVNVAKPAATPTTPAPAPSTPAPADSPPGVPSSLAKP